MKDEIVLYQPNETVQMEVRLHNETVWLNRNQMAMLFGRDVKTIGKHINNALKEELYPTVAKNATVQSEINLVVAKNATTEIESATEMSNEHSVVAKFTTTADRFMIIDEDVYHIGASLKDLGKKWFAFSKMVDIKADHLIKRIQ